MLPRENIQVLDNKSIWNYGSFFYNHYPVFDCVKWLICIFKVMSSIDANIVADTAVFVNDGVFNIAAIANAE